MFAVGDYVTRDGTDIHRVVDAWGGDTIKVVCVRAPKHAWCRVGDEETNMARRYRFIAKLVEPATER